MFKKILGIVLFTAFIAGSIGAQAFTSSTGEITFSTPSDKDIVATSKSFTSKLDLDKKEVIFSVPIQGFRFAKAQMQEHFNQAGVMDSQTYPKAKFKGTFASATNLREEGIHAVSVKGEMTIRGVTKEFTAEGTITTKGGDYSITSSFPIERGDFDINGPRAMMAGKTIEVKLAANYTAATN